MRGPLASLNTTGHREGIVISQLHRQIAEAIQAGHDVDEIELNIIEPAPIAEDEKSALWLYAQVLSERPSAERSPAPLVSR